MAARNTWWNKCFRTRAIRSNVLAICSILTKLVRPTGWLTSASVSR